MDAHTRAVLAQMSPEERKFYESEPQRSWLAQMRKPLSGMNVSEGAKMLRSNMSAFRKVKQTAQPPRIPPSPPADHDTKPGDATTGQTRDR